MEGKGSGEGRGWNGREERASHTAAALGLAKPRAGPIKLIARALSPTHSFFVAQRPSTYSKGNMGKIGGD